MRTIIYSFILLTLCALLSCKKQKYPESQNINQALFYFNGSVDGVPVSYAAGIDNYYMYSSNVQDANGLYSFKADLKQIDCDNCPNSLQININDFKISSINAPVQINQAIIPNNYPLVSGSSYAVKFQSDYNKTAASYLWDFGDGTTSDSANPMHIFVKQGKYNVSLKITGTNSCISSISNIQKIGLAGSCTAMITDTNVSFNSIHFFSNVQGLVPLNYLWNFGDGSTSTLADPTHSYSIIGSYPVQLRVISANDTAYSKYNAVTQGDQSSCAANYTTNIPQTSNLAFSGITINWTDAFGNIFTSNNTLQPSSNYFQVLSVEDYDNNEKGETTKKIRVKFKCRVYNGVNSKMIDNAEATICVSYK